MSRRPNPALTERERNKRDRYPTNFTLVDEIPEPPTTLKEVGIGKWKYVCKTMIERKMLSPDFYLAIEYVCRLYDSIQECEEIIARDGGKVVYTISKTGRAASRVPRMAHPLVQQINLINRQIRLALGDFGMSPASAKNSNIKVNGMSNRPSASGSATSPRRKDLDDFEDSD